MIMSNESYLLIAMEAKAHQGEFLPSMIYHDLPIKHADLSLQNCQITQGHPPMINPHNGTSPYIPYL